jgi:hypothetical protein
MKKFFLVVLFSFLLNVSIFSQESEMPQIVLMALPSYPTPAIVLGIEESIEVRLQIDGSGKVISVMSNAKRPFFQTVIKEAMAEWEFEEADEKCREVVIKIAFKLLPYDSKSNITSRFKSKDTIEIFAKRAKIIDTPSN